MVKNDLVASCSLSRVVVTKASLGYCSPLLRPLFFHEWYVLFMMEPFICNFSHMVSKGQISTFLNEKAYKNLVPSAIPLCKLVLDFSRQDYLLYQLSSIVLVTSRLTHTLHGLIRVA